LFFFSSRRRHTRLVSDWSSDVCSSDLTRRSTPDFGFRLIEASGRPGRHSNRLILGSCSRCREGHHECRPAVLHRCTTAYRYRSRIALDKFAGEPQPKPDPMVVFGGDEWLKEFFAQFALDSWALVCHGDLDLGREV